MPAGTTKREQIISKVVTLLKQNPQGLRYAEIVRRIKDSFPIMAMGNIHGALYQIDEKRPNEIYKPEIGLLRHTSFGDIAHEEQETTTRIREKDFYQYFADYLEGLGECTKAIPLGGKTFEDRWGTPDVIGKKESNRYDIIKRETEIVSMEIKADGGDLITAFGQACAYKSFSHKVYIIIPKSASGMISQG